MSSIDDILYSRIPTSSLSREVRDYISRPISNEFVIKIDKSMTLGDNVNLFTELQKSQKNDKFCSSPIEHSMIPSLALDLTELVTLLYKGKHDTYCALDDEKGGKNLEGICTTEYFVLQPYYNGFGIALLAIIPKRSAMYHKFWVWSFGLVPYRRGGYMKAHLFLTETDAKKWVLS